MGKLVLYLPDGSLHDIPLDKERLSIGRRPDNDICLPYPAVSGEHAAVVTILADSFLEDLGSTNGTLVNGQPVVKHFLRDNDHIDIGRQRLVYFESDGAVAVPLAPDVLRREVLGLHEQVERARERRGERSRSIAAPGASGPGTVDPLFPDDELLSELKPAVLPGAERVTRSAAAGFAVPPASSVSSSGAASAASASNASFASGSGASAAQAGLDATPFAAMERHTTSRAPAPRSKAASRLASTWAATPDVPRPAEKTLPGALLPTGEAVDPPVPSYRVRVLTGPSAGREIAVSGESVTVGRVGVQVACIARQNGNWRLGRLEGGRPLALNGEELPADGAILRPGDHFEVAGVELAFESR